MKNMLKKSLTIILCALLLMSTFSACGEIKGSDAGIVFPIDADPEYLDPQIISYSGSRNIIANCFEGLDRKSTRLNSSHKRLSRMPSSA